MPASARPIPIHVSVGVSLNLYNAPLDVPLLMTFFSAHHSPSTVNMNAREFVIGTVRLSSVFVRLQ
jgi:hypothetical protein